jgi:hypothetical protein
MWAFQDYPRQRVAQLNNRRETPIKTQKKRHRFTDAAVTKGIRILL